MDKHHGPESCLGVGAELLQSGYGPTGGANAGTKLAENNYR